MSNYYYLGRSSFPNLYIWMTLSLALAVGGLVYFLLGLAKFEAANAEKIKLEVAASVLEQKINGTNFEAGLKAVNQYNQVRGKMGAFENLQKDLMENARYNRLVAESIKNRLDAGASAAEIEVYLEEQSTVGLSKEIQNEESLFQLYEGLLNGADRTDEMNGVLANEEKVPILVKSMAQAEDFVIAEGAKAKLSFHKGNNTNRQVQLNDLKGKEAEAFDKTKSQMEKILSTLPELRDTFVEKSSSVDANYSTNYKQQVEIWDKFLSETRRLIEKRRKEEVEIFELTVDLESKSSLLVNRIEGRDWIPPLDLVDGVVLAADAKANIALINIGRSNGLRIGQGFDVYRMRGDKIQETKGRMVVERIYSKISVCRILDGATLNPIADGDVVANGEQDDPYDRKILKSYVLSGRFYKSYSNELVKIMIESAGGRLEEKIHKKINYVVVGDQPDDDDIKLCRQLGVRIVRVRDLPGQLNYSNAEIEALRKLN